MDLKLKGKKVLVTGSSRGIGLATALEFAREGSSVCFSSRNPNVQELKAMLESDAERHLFERCDFTSPHAVGRLREAVAKQWSSLDVLVCNVGSGRGSAEALPDWELF
jgi:NAD(P)-dependent dehydrogenase (short-subunit alcohol dehydrogenase family)